jgi:regulator of sigma E protease
MDIAHQIITLLITLSLLVAFHEYGHFIIARLCGVKVLCFSIGFGPKLFSFNDKKGTEFAFSLLPLGGYVKMLDEREAPVADDELDQAFNRKPVLQRIAVVSAGPIANFLLAIVVYWLVFLGGSTALKPEIFSIAPESIAAKAGLTTGLSITAVDEKPVSSAQDVLLALLNRIGDSGEITFDTDSGRYHLQIEAWLSEQDGEVDVLESLGFGFYRPEVKPIVDDVLAGSAAERAGLKAGDELLAMDGQVINDWMVWVEYVRARAEQRIALEYLRDGVTHNTEITPQLVMQKGEAVGQVGIMVEWPELPKDLLIKKEYGVFSAIPEALTRTWQAVSFTLNSVKKLILGQLSYKQLSGPISIAKVASESAQSGITTYLSLLALLSVSLGVLNLLPIPVLDGGHILFYAIEWLKGSPVSEKIQMLAFQLGMAVVLSIMVLAVVNDISRL